MPILQVGHIASRWRQAQGAARAEVWWYDAQAGQDWAKTMRINDYRAAHIAQTYGTQHAADPSARAPKSAQRPDGATLSSAAQELLRARRAAADAPEVRADLVAELRRQVQAGTYRVDEQALAKRLLPFLDIEV